MTLASPYKGLEPFDDSDLDALLFFGREREREIIVANLIAARVTVLYGPTGVGKSSLLRAGVARALRELPEKPSVIVFDRWSGDDPAVDLAAAVAAAHGDSVEGGLLAVVDRAQRTRDLYLILDQMEEYFVYHDEETSFEPALAELVARPLRVNVLLSLREDSLAKLDRFKPRIPTVYANSLRLDRLERDSGRSAIVRPLGRWNELENSRMSIEPALVEAVLDGVRVADVAPSGGRQPIEGNGRPTTVEAPYLQLVMQRLWDVERAGGSEELRASTLASLGGARQVIADHLERAIAKLSPVERDVAASLFTYLVTPSGTKIAHELADLAEYAGVRAQAAAPVVETLARHRILRADDTGRIEIFHDVLAAEVLSWRRAHDAARALERERGEARRRHRRLAWLAGLASAAFLVTALLAAFALSQRTDARDEARKAKAHELEALASGAIGTDPELSLLLAREAARIAPSATTEATLRDALLASRVRTVVRVEKPVLGAAVRGRLVFAATVDGSVLVADAQTGRIMRSRASGRAAQHVAFAANGTALLTGRDGRLRVVPRGGAAFAVPGVVQATNAAISPDGSLAAVIERGRVRIVGVETGAFRQVLRESGALSAVISADDRRVATGGVDSTVRVWAVRTGRQLRVLRSGGHVAAVAFSPGAAYVAAADTDGLGRIWHVGDGLLTAVVPGDATALTDIAFSTDAAHIVTSSRAGIARVSKADTGSPLFALTGHREWATSVAFSGAAGSSVVTASTDGTVRVWDALFQPQVDEAARLAGAVTLVRFLPDGTLRASTTRKTIVLDVPGGREREEQDGSLASRPPRQVVSSDGTTATVRGDTVVLGQNGRTTVLTGHRDHVTALAFSPDGRLLATASRDHDVGVWDVATGARLHLLQHNSAVRDVQFSPDGRWLITAASRAGLWDVGDGRLVARLQGGREAVTSAGFDATGKTIVTGDADGTVGTYRCEICGGLGDLVALADARLTATGRGLTPEERARYLR